MALDLGFDTVGIAGVESLSAGLESQRLLDWLGEGRQGEMGYMSRSPERRLDPGEVLPGALSIVCVGINYWDPEPEGSRPGTARIARYARGRDYHKTFGGRLKRLESRIREELSIEGSRRYVDTGPVLEKLWAERAGLGWRGKHTNLVSREWGSWLLLGEILLDVELEPDRPETDHCGSCTRCIDVCPTQAIPAP